MKANTKSETISTLSDDELLRRLSELLKNSRRVESELVAHIGEVDARGLYVRKGSSSMFLHIAPARYKIQFTASAELHDKLERLRALMRSSVPDGDFGAIIEEAVAEKLERLESKRFAKTKAPRKSVEETDTSPSSRYIPDAVKRAVCERDQYQCAYIGENGRRCTERDRLEFHHHKPFGHGGDHSVENVHLVCRTHNAFLAEGDYGKDVMSRYKKYGRSSRLVYEPSAVYHIDWRAVRAP